MFFGMFRLILAKLYILLPLLQHLFLLGSLFDLPFGPWVTLFSFLPFLLLLVLPIFSEGFLSAVPRSVLKEFSGLSGGDFIDRNRA